MPPNTLQCTGRPLATRNGPVSNINSAKVEKPRWNGIIVTLFSHVCNLFATLSLARMDQQ